MNKKIQKISLEDVFSLAENCYIKISKSEAERTQHEINEVIIPYVKELKRTKFFQEKIQFNSQIYSASNIIPKTEIHLRSDEKVEKWNSFWKKNKRKLNEKGFFVIPHKKKLKI